MFEIALVGVLLGLALLASLHPRVSATLGLILLAVAVAQVVFFERRWFHSDGSAAGLVLFFAYAGVGAFCASAGVFLLAQGARGKGPRWIPDTAATGVAVVLLAAAIAAPAWFFRDRNAPRPVRADEQVTSTVEVRDRLRLHWKWRWDQRPLQLEIPAVALASNALPVTSDGPRQVALSIGRPDVKFVLHRDASTVEPHLLHELNAGIASSAAALPRSVWVDTSGDGWKLLGMTCRGTQPPAALPCHAPEAPLARYAPFLFALDEVALAGHERRGRCTLAFHYRGRPVTLESAGPCFDPQGIAAFKAASDLLDRLGRDTAQPPSAGAMGARLAQGAQACEAARRDTQSAMNRGTPGDSVERMRATCDAVIRGAAPHAAGDPQAAAALLAALQSRLTLGIGITEHLPLLDAFLAKAPPESREALWGGALRAWNSAGDTAEEAKRATRDSLERVLPAAARVLAPDDPAFEAVYAAASRAAVDESLRPRLIELLRAWDAKAAAAAPGSDLALQVRFRLCRERLAANLERETLRACAEELQAAWERRIAESKTFEPFFSEVELAMHIARMHVSHAWAVGDFAAGAAGVQGVRERAAARFPSPQYDDVRQALQKMEAELAAKAGGAR